MQPTSTTAPTPLAILNPKFPKILKRSQNIENLFKILKRPQNIEIFNIFGVGFQPTPTKNSVNRASVVLAINEQRRRPAPRSPAANINPANPKY